MSKQLMNKPGWLETLWNVNPGLAQRAENDLIEWVENETIDSEIWVKTSNDPELDFDNVEPE